MKAVIKRGFKNYLKNPLFWIGLAVVAAGMYQELSPYLQIHYVKSQEEWQKKLVTEGDIMDGYVPSDSKEQRASWENEVRQTLTDEFGMSQEKSQTVIEEMKPLEIEEAFRYLEEEYSYYNADYAYQDLTYHQGDVWEVNEYIAEKLEEHTFSYYFARKFADFGGLYMCFFAIILLAFLFLQDTRKSTYELLHTKPIHAWQYVCGKITAGFLAVLLALILLNILFILLCGIGAGKSGFPMSPLDFLKATGIYILPNMLMITCVYAIVALVFKNPIPAVPALILYMVYSNMGSIGADGSYGYYGRPLAILVRFPGRFFDTTPPSMFMQNQLFLILGSAILTGFAIWIFKRRRM